jgi:pantothenate kinase
MLQEKVNSHVVTTAQLGIDKLRSIDPELDLGNGLTLNKFSDDVQTMQAAIARYNTAAAELANLNRTMREQETGLRSDLKRLVMGVGAKYGEKSTQYETVQKLWRRTQRSSAATAVSKGAIEG